MHLPSITTDIANKNNLPKALVSKAYISKCRNKILVVPNLIQHQNHTSSQGWGTGMTSLRQAGRQFVQQPYQQKEPNKMQISRMPKSTD